MKRPRAHVLEEESKQALRNLLPTEWIIRDIHPDYGLDCEVVIVENQKITNLMLWLQLKATEKIKHTKRKITYQMETKNLKYYEGCSVPVLILYYIKSENVFYYLFAQEFIKENISINKPNWRKQKTVTLEFPLNSKLKDIECLRSIATSGRLYIAQQQLNIEARGAQYWLNGIPKSDDKELKERTLNALLYMRNEKYHEAIREFEDVLRLCVISPTEKTSILLNLGNAYYSLSKINEAFINYQAVLRLAKKLDKQNSLEARSPALGNIGNIYSAKGELDKALEYHKEALKIHKEIGYTQGEANQLCNIGNIYSVKGELDKALEYYKEALKVDKEIGSAQGEASDLGNIGLIYKAKGELDKALEYLEKGLKIDKEIGYAQGEANQLGNIGNIYKAKGELDKALEYLEKGLKIIDKYNLVYGRDIIQNAIESIKKKK